MSRNFKDRMHRLLAKENAVAAETASESVTLVPDAPRGREIPFSEALLDERGRHNPELPAPAEEVREALSVITTVFPPEFVHGGWSMAEIPRRLADGLEVLAEATASGGRRTPSPPFAWNGSAFLDTETTSLSTGSGVYVFLTGIGVFEERGFVVRQYLMRTPEAEVDCLEAVAADLAARQRLVTFFGKAFDQHRLADRARVVGVDLPFPDHHFDLYWMSRRLVGARYADLKLRTLEHELLRFYRFDDLPGSAAPEAWFQALRGEGQEALSGVLKHNLLDVVSLVSLAAELALRMESPADAEERKNRAFALLRSCSRGADGPELLTELEATLPGRATAREWLAFAGLSRAHKEHDRQYRALQEARRLAPSHCGVLVELAKCCEHRRKDPAAALHFALTALDFARTPERPALKHRIARLHRLLQPDARWKEGEVSR